MLGPSHSVLIATAGSLTETPEPAEVRVICPPGGVMETYLRFQLSLRRKLKAIARDFRPDIILVNHAEMPDLLCRHDGLSRPFVVVTHTSLRTQLKAAIIGRVWHNPLDNSERALAAFAPFLLASEAAYWKRTRNAIFVSNSIQRAIDKALRPQLRHSFVIRNGIDTSILTSMGTLVDAYKNSGDAPRILFVGRLLSSKGLAVLFSALRRIRDLPWECFVVGPGNSTYWKEHSRRLGIDLRTHVIGPLRRGEVLGLMRESSIFVLPSIWESCPYTLLEAMWSGLPVVASRVGDIPEILQDGQAGLLFERGDSAGLAVCLRALLRENVQATEMGAKGKAIIEAGFTAREMGMKTLEAFEQILAQP